MKKIALYIFFSAYLCQVAIGQVGVEFRVWGASSGCYISSVAVDQQHNTIVTGYYHKEKNSADTTRLLEVNGKTFPLQGYSGSFLAKFNQAKEILWLKMTQREFRNIYSGIHLLLDNNSNIYFIGQSGKSVTGSGITGETFINSYSKDGVLLWEKVLGGVTDNGELQVLIDRPTFLS